jgi:very-short-patch-repair endonuclease
MTRLFNKAPEKEKRRILRKNSTEAEVMVWAKLRGNQALGYKFRRQYSVGAYVIDYYCPALKLAVEIDGDSHSGAEAMANDEHRQASIESLGIRFLRFRNEDIYENLEGVLKAIAEVIETLSNRQRSAGKA